MSIRFAIYTSVAEVPLPQRFLRCYASLCKALLVPLAGIEPALLAELDFESSASTNSATGAFRDIGRKAQEVAKPAEYSGREGPVNPRVSGMSRRDQVPMDGTASAGGGQWRRRRMHGPGKTALPCHRVDKALPCDRRRLDSGGPAG